MCAKSKASCHKVVNQIGVQLSYSPSQLPWQLNNLKRKFKISARSINNYRPVGKEFRSHNSNKKKQNEESKNQDDRHQRQEKQHNNKKNSNNNSIANNARTHNSINCIFQQQQQHRQLNILRFATK